MGSIKLDRKKALKLINVLCYRAELKSEDEDNIHIQLEQMKNYINNHVLETEQGEYVGVY